MLLVKTVVYASTILSILATILWYVMDTRYEDGKLGEKRWKALITVYLIVILSSTMLWYYGDVKLGLRGSRKKF